MIALDQNRAVERDLLRRCKRGDSGAEGELVERHRGWLWGMVAQAQRRGVLGDRDDMWQEAALALVQSARKYDLRRRVLLSTFAARRVAGSLIDYWRRSGEHLLSGVRRNHPEAPPDQHVTSLSYMLLDREDGELRHFDAPDDSDREAALATENWAACRHAIEEHCGPRDGLIVALRLEGRLNREAGKAVGVSESRASQVWHQRIAQLRRSKRFTDAITN